MKKMKWLFAGLIVMALFAGIYSFTNKPVDPPVKAWFSYHGAANDAGEQIDPDNYTYESAAPCNTGSVFCSVYATVEDPEVEDEGDWKPLADNLEELQSMSDGFTERITEDEGSVRLEP